VNSRTKTKPSNLPESRRSHRILVLAALLGICRKMERMQASPEARRACRDVGERLADLLNQERSPAAIKQR
jgi:hypothetical protein